MAGRNADLAAAYRRLGLMPGAEARAVRKARLDLVRRFHPDRHGGRKSVDGDLAEINAAFDLIKASWAEPAETARAAAERARRREAMARAVREAARQARAERIRRMRAAAAAKARKNAETRAPRGKPQRDAAQGLRGAGQRPEPSTAAERVLSPAEMRRARAAIRGFLSYRAGFDGSGSPARGRVSHRV